MATRFRPRFENVRARLAQVAGRASKAVNDEMEKEAREIERIAKLLAPRELGFLESSIKTQGYNQRRRWVVFIDTTVVADGGYPVGVYGIRLHEADVNDFNWGPGTRSKPGYNGMKAGPRFLERAYRSRVRGITRRLADAGQRAINSLPNAPG